MNKKEKVLTHSRKKREVKPSKSFRSFSFDLVFMSLCACVCGERPWKTSNNLLLLLLLRLSLLNLKRVDVDNSVLLCASSCAHKQHTPTKFDWKIRFSFSLCFSASGSLAICLNYISVGLDETSSSSRETKRKLIMQQQ